MEDKILRKLEERLANGEISEDTYKKIKARHEKQEKMTQEEFDDEEDEMDSEEIPVDVGGKTKRVSLSGASKSSDVNCEYFSSSGASKIEGYLKADEAKISGATKIEGDANVGELSSSGSFKVVGTTEAKKMSLSGASKFEGKVKAEHIKSMGSSKFEADIEVDEFSSSGALKIMRDINAKTFTATGAFRIEGTLKAHEVMLKPGGDCYVKHIKGGDILVESSGGSGLFSMFKKGKLEAEKITGDNIYLENTMAKTVEGKDVKIGPGCKVGTVRGKNVKVHESASVDNKENL